MGDGGWLFDALLHEGPLGGDPPQQPSGRYVSVTINGLGEELDGEKLIQHEHLDPAVLAELEQMDVGDCLLVYEDGRLQRFGYVPDNCVPGLIKIVRRR